MCSINIAYTHWQQAKLKNITKTTINTFFRINFFKWSKRLKCLVY